jgi:predicted DNA-binding protein
MTSDGKPAPKKGLWGSKRRYSILLSEELAERFERVARLRNGAKSALVEEALDRRLHPEKYPLIDDALLRRLDEQAASLATLRRDAAINTEMISLFVRYFLTITPPLADSEQQPARALGRQRFEVFVAQIGRRLASDRRLVSDVLQSIAVHKPDLFATAADDAPTPTPQPAQPKSSLRPTVASLKVNGQKPATEFTDERHG